MTLTAVSLAGVPADAVTFDNLNTGAPPPGWTPTKTGTGEAHWTVEQDATALSQPNVLKQSGQATHPAYIKDDTNLKDGFVEVKFKPISGREDQAGGLIWRAKTRLLRRWRERARNNVTIYHTITGRRTEKKRTNTRGAFV